MPNKIIIIRHGQTDYNVSKILQGHLDTPLNAVGENEARETARILKNEKIDVFFSSDLQRALKTAQLALIHHDKPLHVTKLLRERNFGRFQGLTFGDIGKFIEKFGEQANFSFHGREKEFGIETEEELAERIRAFKKILDKHRGRTVAVFTHGGLIRRLLVALGLPKETVEGKHIPNAVPYVLIRKGDTYILEQ